MKPVDQDKFGAPYGNCFAACLASILEIELDELRDFEAAYARDAAIFEETGVAPNEWWETLQKDVLEPRNYRALYFTGGEFAPIGYAIANGKGPRGLGHCVVSFFGQLAHDPHPDRFGLDEVEGYAVLIQIGRRIEKEMR